MRFEGARTPKQAISFQESVMPITKNGMVTHRYHPVITSCFAVVESGS